MSEVLQKHADKPKAFWFHYNKLASRAASKNIMTIHYEGKCHLVEDLDCLVPTKVRHRKSQPHCVLCGKGVLKITGKKAVIK